MTKYKQWTSETERKFNVRLLGWKSGKMEGLDWFLPLCGVRWINRLLFKSGQLPNVQAVGLQGSFSFDNFPKISEGQEESSSVMLWCKDSLVVNIILWCYSGMCWCSWNKVGEATVSRSTSCLQWNPVLYLWRTVAVALKSFGEHLQIHSHWRGGQQLTTGVQETDSDYLLKKERIGKEYWTSWLPAKVGNVQPSGK